MQKKIVTVMAFCHDKLENHDTTSRCNNINLLGLPGGERDYIGKLLKNFPMN